MKKVFISHAADDAAWSAHEIEQLALAVEAAGGTVLLDHRHQTSMGRKLSPAEWREWMNASLADADHVVCLVSEEYQTHWARDPGTEGGFGIAHESIRIVHQLYFNKSRNDGKGLTVRKDGALRKLIPQDLQMDFPDYQWPSEKATLLLHLTGQKQARSAAPEDPDVIPQEETFVIAWQKVLERLLGLDQGRQLIQWFLKELLSQVPTDQTVTASQVVQQLWRWRNQTEARSRLARLRAVMSEWSSFKSTIFPASTPAPLSERAETLLTHLSILLGAEAAAAPEIRDEARRSLDAIFCPDTTQKDFWDQHELAMAVACHLFNQKGLAVQKRGGRWRVENMLRTTAFPAVDAAPFDPEKNLNVRYISQTLEARAWRLDKKKKSADTDIQHDMQEYKERHGAAVFVLDDAHSFESEDVQFCADQGLHVVAGADPTWYDPTVHNPALDGLVQAIHHELKGFLRPDSSHATHKTGANMQPTDQTSTTTNNFWGPVGAVATGAGSTQHSQITQTTNGSTLTDLINALQALQRMLPAANPQSQTIADVVEIAQHQEEGQSSAQRKISGLFAWVKRVADGAETVDGITTTAASLKDKAAAVYALAAIYWPQILTAIQTSI